MSGSDAPRPAVAKGRPGAVALESPAYGGPERQGETSRLAAVTTANRPATAPADQPQAAATTDTPQAPSVAAAAAGATASATDKGRKRQRWELPDPAGGEENLTLKGRAAR